jgi:hypothetical protein
MLLFFFVLLFGYFVVFNSHVIFITAWTASWVNGNHWAYFHGHYLFLHEDKYYMGIKNNKITKQKDKKKQEHDVLVSRSMKLKYINIYYILN